MLACRLSVGITCTKILIGLMSLLASISRVGGTRRQPSGASSGCQQRCIARILVAALGMRVLLSLCCQGDLATILPVTCLGRQRSATLGQVGRSAVPPSSAELPAEGAGQGDRLQDWRAVRAALVASGGLGIGVSGAQKGWVYLSPILEVGTVLLAGAGYFALSRPELHKAVAVVLRHGAGSQEESVAVVVNRLDTSGRGPGYGGIGGVRWRLVFGESSDGVQRCQHAEAIELLPGFVAIQGDDDVCVEDAGFVVDVKGQLAWPPQGLQTEIDQGLWTPVAADAIALTSAVKLIAPSNHGKPCWDILMDYISDVGARSGSGESSSSSTAELGDELLDHWGAKRWGSSALVEYTPPVFPTDAQTFAVEPSVGSLILMGADAFSSGRQQHLHKAILLVIAADSDGVIAVCLNRPITKVRSSHVPSGARSASRTGLFSKSSPLPLRPQASRTRRQRPASEVVHFGGSDDWDRWSCLVASGGTPPCSPSGQELLAEPIGESGLWLCQSAATAWRQLRETSQQSGGLFARGATRLGHLELELLRRRGQAGVVSAWTVALQDVAAACTSYHGPVGTGVRLGLYGDHHGFGLWERAVSHAYHGGDDHAATAVRGVVGDRSLREWASARFSSVGIGTPVS